MEVHFTPEVQAQLEQMARATGRRSDELVENVLAIFSRILPSAGNARSALRGVESGEVKLIPGDEVFARLRAKSASRRA